MKLSGTYTLLMVDADIPPAQAGGPTTELLHWMQTDMVSASTQTTIGGMKVYEMTNPNNVSALATYISPNPPNVAPTSHRYVQMLLNTTNLSASKNLTTLMKEAASRGNFNAADVVKANGLTVLMGNSFNVTNAAALGSTGSTSASNSTGQGVAASSGASARATGSGTGQTGTLTLDALLSTAAPGAATNVTAKTTITTAAPTTVKATEPINSATLTFDALISTGGAQASALARTGASNAVGSPDAAPWFAGVGALAAAIFML